MATGLVPVVSDLAVFRDYVEPGVTGFVFDHRGESAATNLAAALRSALADPARLAEVGRAAAAKAGSFSNQNVAKMYLRDFEELLGHDRRRT
jgi:glycosyltransferase involved in cell wall biosynthesis